MIHDILRFRSKADEPHKTQTQLSTRALTEAETLVAKNVLLTALEPFLPGSSDYSALASDESSRPKTVWEALLSVPREYLDPYQPEFRRVKKLHRDKAPLIDYLTAKLAILSEKLERAKARQLTEYRPSSTAFVTFRNAAIARRVLSEMPTSPQFPLGCQTRPCPHYSDIIWPRLNKSVYRADVMRGWVVGILIFAATIVWM